MGSVCAAMHELPGYSDMLDSIRLTDFKNHADTQIGLRELTLLVGPNGAGKSGVLQALQLASRFFQHGYPLSELEQLDILMRRGCNRAIIELAWTEPRGLEDAYERRVKLAIAPADGSLPRAEFLSGGVYHEVPATGFTWASADYWRGAAGLPIRDKLGVAVHLRLNAPRLAEPSYLGSAAATIASDGYGLASAIAHLMTFERDRFAELETTLRSVMPAVKQIRVRRVEIEVSRSTNDSTRVLADELVLDMSSGAALPPQALSEGTLIVLGLLTVLVGPDCPRLVLIDDIDQALHPRAQSQLVSLLRDLIKVRAGLQIVATSHSPYLIDALAPEEVWVLAARPDGIAAAACLAEHPDAERFRNVLRTGEFLSSVGEDWVMGGEATDAAGIDR